MSLADLQRLWTFGTLSISIKGLEVQNLLLSSLHAQDLLVGAESVGLTHQGHLSSRLNKAMGITPVF